MTLMESLQYPIGRFHWAGRSTPSEQSGWIQTIAATPRTLQDAIAGLTPEQLDVPYAWHDVHHVSQIMGLRERRGWISNADHIKG